MKTGCTDIHASATLVRASAVGRPRRGAWVRPASPSTNATATRLAAPAPIRTVSAAARDASSLRAIRAVVVASRETTVSHTHVTNTAAAVSEAKSTATD